MRVECPHCSTTGNIDEALIPAGGGNIRCPKCSELFFAGGTAAPPHQTDLPDDFGAALSDSTSQDSPDSQSENPYLQDPNASSDDLSTGKDLFDQQSSQGGDTFVYKIDYFGKGSSLFVLYLLNYIKTIFTLGIYHFWAKVNVIKYTVSQLEINGDRMEFHGKAMDILKGFLVGLVVIALLVGLLFLIIAQTQNPESPLIFIIIYGTILPIMPFAIIGTLKYRFTNTSWRNIYFSFRGRYKTYLPLFLKGIFLTLFTLYLYLPFFHANNQRFVRENSYFGDSSFDYSGDGKEIFKTIFIKAYFLIPLTLGIYFFWYAANLVRYDWEHTTFNGFKFSNTITGGKFFKLMFTNLLIMIFTLGIGLAWVKTRTLKARFSWIVMEGSDNLDTITQEIVEGGKIGEEFAEMFALDIGSVVSW